MSYKSFSEILNAVFDSDDSALKAKLKESGEVLNMVLDETGEPALKVKIDGIVPSGGGGEGIIDGEVDTHADLPAAASHTGEIFIVAITTGLPFINRKQAGLYRSDGVSWSLLDVDLQADKVYYSGLLSSANVQDGLDELKNIVDTKSDSSHNHDAGYAALSHSHTLSDMADNPVVTDGSGTLYLADDGIYKSISSENELPTQVGNEGKYLTTDGSNVSWGDVSTGAVIWGDITGVLSEQLDIQAALDAKSDSVHNHALSDISNSPIVLTGNGTLYLADDGLYKPVVSSGGASLPDQTGHTGKFLKTDGASTSWSDIPNGEFPSYSTSEVLTTERWINGKPIYMKTIDGGAIPANETKVILTGIGSDIAENVWVDEQASFTYGFYSMQNFVIPVNYADFVNNVGVYISLSDSNGSYRINWGSNVDWSTYYQNSRFTLKYTKTADTPESPVADVILSNSGSSVSIQAGIESLTGEIRNGKTIYQMEVDCGGLPNSGEKLVAINSYNSSYTYWIELGNSYASTVDGAVRIPLCGTDLNCSVAGSNISINTTSDKSAFVDTKIVLRYTK
jgi:hypothetical protein